MAQRVAYRFTLQAVTFSTKANALSQKARSKPKLSLESRLAVLDDENYLRTAAAGKILELATSFGITFDKTFLMLAAGGSRGRRTDRPSLS